MTQLFAEGGECIPVTVLEAEPNPVVQKKTKEREGYTALQIGFGRRRPKHTPKPLAGHFQKAQVAPRRHLAECRVTPEEAAGYEVGSELGVSLFQVGQRVDVIGTSKGRGTAGVVKRHHFPLKGHAHGAHEYFRHGGSVGPGSFPGHVIKGLRMPGRLGNRRATVLNLEVVRVEPEKHLLFVRGAVPGCGDGLVRVRPSVKSPAS
jgi:large subunit ribosomal protein L3